MFYSINHSSNKGALVENCLKELRKQRKITQTELADALLTTRQTIYLIEKNRVVPSLELAFKLSNFFSCKVEDIFQYRSRPAPAKDDLFSIF
jgi:putative transcriptional regulator